MMKCEWKFIRFSGSIAHETTLHCGKGIMRIIFTVRQSLAATPYDRILQRLVGILGVTSKNPSNPNFDQYLFESLSGLLRQVKETEAQFMFTTHSFAQVHRCSKSGNNPRLRRTIVWAVHLHTTARY